MSTVGSFLFLKKEALLGECTVSLLGWETGGSLGLDWATRCLRLGGRQPTAGELDALL